MASVVARVGSATKDAVRAGPGGQRLSREQCRLGLSLAHRRLDHEHARPLLRQRHLHGRHLDGPRLATEPGVKRGADVRDRRRRPARGEFQPRPRCARPVDGQKRIGTARCFPRCVHLVEREQLARRDPVRDDHHCRQQHLRGPGDIHVREPREHIRTADEIGRPSQHGPPRFDPRPGAGEIGSTGHERDVRRRRRDAVVPADHAAELRRRSAERETQLVRQELLHRPLPDHLVPHPRTLRVVGQPRIGHEAVLAHHVGQPTVLHREGRARLTDIVHGREPHGQPSHVVDVAEITSETGHDLRGHPVIQQ
jgi:hypothetical protein